MKIVIALGGNALGNSPQEQIEILKDSVKPIADLIQEGHQVILAHGNGPQVGMVLNAFDKDIELPMVEANAMTQGYIGYQLQQSLQNELMNRKINKPVVSLVTQVVVDENDSAFLHPTKPIGPFLSKEDALVQEELTGHTFIEDSGRGYRRVVPSPKPVDIVEIESIKQLVEDGQIVITVGGGGIPVIKNQGLLSGIDAVIDKDFASSQLAIQVQADLLIILTAVDQIAINFNKPNQQWLKSINIEQANEFIQQGHFAPGSMLPKIEAALNFVQHNPNNKVLITSLEKASLGIQEKTGTIIRNR